MRELKIKVCGMRSAANRQALEELPVDLLGFIFYPPSPRSVTTLPAAEAKKLLDTAKARVGVFVNENPFKILKQAQVLRLTHVQLHGEETPETCRLIRQNRVQVIKVFRVDENFDFSLTEKYAGAADFFLFDTKAEQPGGTGRQFNWQILENYRLAVPFFLSGGITPADAENIRQVAHPALYGVDLNSGFEEEPGVKNFEKLKSFIDQLKNE